jgi:hypothetical protein
MSSKTKLPMGRPTKFTPETRARLVQLISRGVPYRHACSAVRISYQSFVSYRHDHSDFAEEIEEAVGQAIEKRLIKIEAASAAGDWRADAWILEHIFPENFAKSRIQVEVAGGLDHAFVIPQQTLNDIAEARARSDQKQNEQLSERNGN